MTAHPPAALTQLRDAGVAIWLDDLSRNRIRSGDLARLVEERHLAGVTTNPSIFQAALAKGEAYAEQIGELAAAGATLEEAVETITTDDVREACDVLADVAAGASNGDGRVSLEVDPRLARSTDATLEEARRLWARVDRPNLYIKIPATLEGLPAITGALADGISVNVTLIFSLERYLAVVDAWLTGLEQAKAAGRDLSGIASVASFFVSRVDSAVDAKLDALGTPEAAALRGKAALANARLAYAAFEDVLASERWQALAAAGAQVQRPLWASTGVKDPAYKDTLYVEELVAPQTVNTMPEATLEAMADHGVVSGDTVSGTREDAAGVLAGLAELGISLDEVTHQLEQEGVEKFDAAWEDLLSTVRSALEAGASR